MKRILPLVIALSVAPYFCASAATAQTVGHRVQQTIAPKQLSEFRRAEVVVSDTTRHGLVHLWVGRHHVALRLHGGHARLGIRLHVRRHPAPRALQLRAQADHGHLRMRVLLRDRVSPTAYETRSGHHPTRPGSGSTGSGTTTNGSGSSTSGTTTSSPGTTSSDTPNPFGSSGTATSGSPGAADPSGVPMPTTAPAGYTPVMTDDFTSSTSQDKCWGEYSANPIPSSPTGAWTPSEVSFQNGEAVLSSSFNSLLGKWTSGGMSSGRCTTQTYGLYEIRFRMDQAQGVKYAILLWPHTMSWPAGGEIDWGEDGGGNRSQTTLTSIYAGAGGAEAKLPQQHINADFSQWQTLALKWSPGQETEYLNGVQVAQINSSSVPSDPMDFDIQTETNTNCSISNYYTCINSATPSQVNMDVDWVAVYKPTA